MYNISFIFVYMHFIKCKIYSCYASIAKCDSCCEETLIPVTLWTVYFAGISHSLYKTLKRNLRRNYPFLNFSLMLIMLFTRISEFICTDKFLSFPGKVSWSRDSRIDSMCRWMRCILRMHATRHQVHCWNFAETRGIDSAADRST